jgi:hypothetical protein
MTPQRPTADAIKARLEERWDDIVAIITAETRPTDTAGHLDFDRWKVAILKELVEPIANYEPDFTPNAKVAKQLDRFAWGAGYLAAALNALETALGSARGSALRKKLGGDALHTRLKRLEAKSIQLKPAKVEKKGILRYEESGGSRRGRSDRVLKKMAAENSFWMLIEWLQTAPTVAHGSPYLRLTETLFYVATGRKAGDVSRVCSEVLNAVKRATSSSKAEWRELSKHLRNDD